MAEVRALVGELQSSADAAYRALALAHQVDNKRKKREGLVYQAWAEHLLGHSVAAAQDFAAATVLEHEIDPAEEYLYSNRGIWHAEQLRRSGQTDAALRITESNLKGWAIPYKRPDHEAQCRRLLGDLAADMGHDDTAYDHYQTALTIAQKTNNPRFIIEALLARGRWAARHGHLTGLGDPSGLAFSDLNEALGYAVDGGYRIYEADIRIALAWAHLAAGEPDRARQEALRRAQDEAERAQRMSADMGYHWGQVDAAEVLAALDEAATKTMEHPE